MRLIEIDKLERELHLLKLKLKEAHDWIRHMGNWEEYKKRSKHETRHSKSTRNNIQGNNNKES
jgi:hypothetical protein